MAFNRYLSKPEQWNGNAIMTEIIGRDVEKINEALLSGDVSLILKSCRILYNNVHGHPNINKKNLEIVDTKLRTASRRLMRLPPNWMFSHLNASQQKYLESVMRTLQDTHLSLMDEIYSSGLWFPENKKDPRHAGMEIK